MDIVDGVYEHSVSNASVRTTVRALKPRGLDAFCSTARTCRPDRCAEPAACLGGHVTEHRPTTDLVQDQGAVCVVSDNWINQNYALVGGDIGTASVLSENYRDSCDVT